MVGKGKFTIYADCSKKPASYGPSRTDSSSVPAPSDCSIYVVDDDPIIANLVFHNLRSSGYRVAQFANGSEMLDFFESERPGVSKWPDLVVLDIMMPGPNGLEVARNLREFSQIPILMLSIQDETDTKLVALDLGADDYLTKPFEVAELLARVRAILRRTLPPTEDPPLTRYRRGELWIDLLSTRVTLGNKAVRLTGREWAVLRVMVEHAGQVVAPRQVLQQAWGAGIWGRGGLYPDLHHQTAPQAGAKPQPAYIMLARGMGYRLAEPG